MLLGVHMANTALRLVNGIGRMQTITGLDTSLIYDETIDVSSVIPFGTNITLPNAGTYQSKELEVYLNGQFLEVGQHFNYVGTGTRTQIVMISRTLGDQDFLRFRKEGDPSLIYDESLVPGVLVANTPITLPNSGVFGGSDLRLYRNGQFLTHIFDYNYIGSMPPYTQFSLTFDLGATDRIRMRKVPV
jgi:hypothetical protein